MALNPIKGIQDPEAEPWNGMVEDMCGLTGWIWLPLGTEAPRPQRLSLAVSTPGT
jgi:hypothetical protein